MRVYFPPDPRLSRAMERIRQAFIKHAPTDTVFLQNPTADSVHCIHWMGQNPAQHTARDEILFSQPTLPRSSRYLIFLHCPNWPYPQHEATFKRLLQRAQLVVTHTPEFLTWGGPTPDVNLHVTPWGYDPELFYYEAQPKKYTILTTGYSVEQEAIDSVVTACHKMSCSVVHVGYVSRYHSPSPTFTQFTNVSDAQLRSLYNQARFVSGLRREGGFELPILEGYACGAQPVTFNHMASRRYFKDFAILVPNVPRDELTPKLMEVLKPKTAITPQKEVLQRFQWGTIMRDVWNHLTEA